MEKVIEINSYCRRCNRGHNISTIVIAVLGGVVAVLDGGKGTIKTLRKVRDGQKKRKAGKDELKGVELELAKKKTVREYFQNQQPTAPPIYPGL